MKKREVEDSARMEPPAPVDEGSDVAKLHQALVDKLTRGQRELF